MRRIFLAFLAFALVGCGDYEARRELLSENRPDTIPQLHDLTLASFREWQGERPRSCNSSTLLNARASVLATAGLARPDRYGFQAAYDAASWMLEVADGAAGEGCATIARDLYLRVKSIYTGAGYIRLRDHALTAAQHLGSS